MLSTDSELTTQREVQCPMMGLKLSELISALSHALDITEGQPEGHCVRCCWIGMHVGRELNLPESQFLTNGLCSFVD